MNERTQRTAIYDEPGDEGSELRGVKRFTSNMAMGAVR